MTINYTSKDYESIRQDMIHRVSQIAPHWSDHNPSDLGVVLLELVAGVGDMLSYYLNAQAGEAYIATVRQRQNLIHLTQLIGYRLDGPVAASTALRFSLSAPLDGSLMIPKGTRCLAVLDREEIPFWTTEEVVIYPGQISADVPALQGYLEEETAVASGMPFLITNLHPSDIAQGTLNVVVNGVSWCEVSHFQESEAEDPHFVSVIDALGKVQLRFGDGIRGAIPSGSIEISYLRTLGSNGNIRSGLITQVLSSIYWESNLVSIAVTNPIPATGGADLEHQDHARKQAPAELRTLWRAVTKEDFLSLAEGFPGVAKAQILDLSDCSNTRYYRVNLVVAPDGGGLPSPLLFADLRAFLEARKVITTEIQLFVPDYVRLSIQADVYAFAGQDLLQVQTRLETALADFFDFDKVQFQQTIHVSDLVALIDGVPGISHLHLLAPNQDHHLSPGQIPALGDVQLTMRHAT